MGTTDLRGVWTGRNRATPRRSGRSLAHAATLLAVFIAIALPLRVDAAPADDAPAQPNGHPIADGVKFLTGGALALAAHEGGHLFFDVLFDADPGLKRVSFGPFPFFAITHRGDLSPRREFTVSSAGFWVQEGTNEWLLTTRPDLRREHAPLAKGVLAFNVLASIGYGTVALFKAGPFERDTRGMAAASRLDEPTIGLVVIAPALLDGWRYFDPDSRWAKWASRAAKIGSVLLVLRR